MSNMARLTDDHRPVATRTIDELREVLDGVTGSIEVFIDAGREQVLFKRCRGPAIAVHEGNVGTVGKALWNGGRPLI
jgi:hypothetical protein